MCFLSENVPEIGKFFDSKFAKLYSDVILMSHKVENQNESYDGTNKNSNEFISLNGAVDSNREYIRKRSSYESKKRKKR